MHICCKERMILPHTVSSEEVSEVNGEGDPVLVE